LAFLLLFFLAGLAELSEDLLEEAGGVVLSDDVWGEVVVWPKATVANRAVTRAAISFFMVNPLRS